MHLELFTEFFYLLSWEHSEDAHIYDGLHLEAVTHTNESIRKAKSLPHTSYCKQLKNKSRLAFLLPTSIFSLSLSLYVTKLNDSGRNMETICRNRVANSQFSERKRHILTQEHRHYTAPLFTASPREGLNFILTHHKLRTLYSTLYSAHIIYTAHKVAGTFCSKNQYTFTYCTA
jgi:hypothetical protein